AINADASQTATTQSYDAAAAGKLIGQTVADVSANGLVKSFVYDTTGKESLGTLETAAANLLAGTALPALMLATDIIETDATTLNGTADTTTVFADANGSYRFSQTVAASSAAATQGFASGSATHAVDANGIDSWSWQDGSTGGSSGQTAIDVATEKQDVAVAN